jgi:hypothetical protein
MREDAGVFLIVLVVVLGLLVGKIPRAKDDDENEDD